MRMTDPKSFRLDQAAGARHGFTLVELMVVIVIIAILAAMSLTIQRAAVQSARHERTVTTIRKIDAALTAAYEKYQYRKPDISELILTLETQVKNQFPERSEVEQKRIVNSYLLMQLASRSGVWKGWLEKELLKSEDEDPSLSPFVHLAPYAYRTLLLRELLLADFPDSLREVKYILKSSVSPVQEIYQSYLPALQEDEKGNPISGDISADLLYLIVMNTSPETRGTFLEREIADTNKNGIPEFVDGWGNPIRFIRWAPALRTTNRQPTFDEALRVQKYLELKQQNDFGIDLNNSNGSDYSYDEYYSLYAADGYPLSDYDFFVNFDYYYPGLLEFASDPFDPVQSLNGWLLTPLIYSAGPDQEYGMKMTKKPYNYEDLTDLDLELADSLFGDGVGSSPFDGGIGYGIGLGSAEADDNITNHNLE